MFDDEIKGISRFLYALGFPLALFAIAGLFSVGIAVWRGEISRQSKSLLLGVFLIAVCGVFWYLPKIYRRVIWDGDKWIWSFSFGAVVGTLISLAAAYFSGTWLWPLFNN